MDQYFDHISHIVQERKTSSRTCLLLQDMLDLRKVNIIYEHSIKSKRINSEWKDTQVFSDPQNNWVPQQPKEVPKTMKEIHVKEDLEKMDNQTGVTKEIGKTADGEPDWSRQPQKTTGTSVSKEVSMEAITEVTLKTGNKLWCLYEIEVSHVWMNPVFFQSVANVNSQEAYVQDIIGDCGQVPIREEGPPGPEETQGNTLSWKTLLSSDCLTGCGLDLLVCFFFF